MGIATKKSEKLYLIKIKPHPILTCTCGNKYIKTREKQKVCLFCIRELNNIL